MEVTHRRCKKTSGVFGWDDARADDDERFFIQLSHSQTPFARAAATAAAAVPTTTMGYGARR